MQWLEDTKTSGLFCVSLCKTIPFIKDKICSYVGDKSMKRSFAPQSKCIYIYSFFYTLMQNILYRLEYHSFFFWNVIFYNVIFFSEHGEKEKNINIHSYLKGFFGSICTFWKYKLELNCWCPPRYIYILSARYSCGAININLSLTPSISANGKSVALIQIYDLLCVQLY